MCYRYQLALSPKLEPIAEAAKRSKLYYNNIGWLGKPVLTEGEIFPNSIVPVLAPSRNGKKTAYPMWWGYKIQGLGRPLVNARSETAAEKETFRESWVEHRCAVPASWYYEWEHFKSPSGKVKAGDTRKNVVDTAILPCYIFYTDKKTHCSLKGEMSNEACK